MKTIQEIMSERRLLVVLRGIPSDSLCDVLDALYDGGIRLAEITFDTAGNTSDKETAEMIARAAKHAEGKIVIGAGTVTQTEQLKLAYYSGAKFIVSPNTDTHIIEQTKLLDLVSIPGAMTPSEIFSAINAGADYVKLFPIYNLGPQFVKYVLSPLNNAKLLAVAGSNLDNIPEYLEAGCAGFGIGTNIVNKKLCEEGRFDLIRENAKKYADACKVK